MQCTICGISIDNLDELIDDDWIFCFFDGEQEHGPLCPSCSDTLTYITQDGEHTLKKEYKGKIVYNDQLDMFDNDPLADVILGFILN
jgi:hypothetical protein